MKKIVAKFPNLRRPPLSNPRFDYRMGKLISVNTDPNQQQPIIVDPQNNLNWSGGEVLCDKSLPSLQNGEAGSQSSTEGIELMAQSMGFEREHIKQVIQR